MTPAQREAWLDWRRDGLGGSDVAAILGLSSFSGPWDVYLSKVQAVDGGDSSVKARGRHFERAIAEWAADELQLGELEDGAPVVDPVLSWIRGTPDFYLIPPFDSDKAEEGLECKSSRVRMDELTISYRIQVAWYMRITGLERWHVAVWSTMSDKLELYCVERDLEIEQRLIERAGKWWRRHVVNQEPPALDGSAEAGRWLHSQHPEPNDVMIQADPELEQIARRIRELQKVEKMAQAERKELENRVKAEIGDATGVRGDFGHFKWSRYSKSTLSGKNLRKAHPELETVLDEFTTTKPQARLVPKWKDQQ